MSYQEKMVWTIMPKESFKVLRNCSKCGSKSKYSNTGNFRVNANGNFLDVWLIYQCDKCKNTLNLEIFGRVNPSKVPRSHFQSFLANDEDLAFTYGRSKEFFQKNRVEIDQEEMEYEVLENEVLKYEQQECEELEILLTSDAINCNEKNIIIKNPYSLKIRLDKVIAKQLEISRTWVKKLVENGIIFNNQERDLTKILIYDDLEFTIKNL